MGFGAGLSGVVVRLLLRRMAGGAAICGILAGRVFLGSVGGGGGLGPP